MKCIIVYLTITGNTEIIARAIQTGVKEAAGDCEIATLKEVNWRNLYKYDLIGFGCPLMGARGPEIFINFINGLRFVGGKHCFAFMTHGTRPETFFPYIVPRLKRRGMIVIGTYNCYAPCYISGMPDPYPTAGHPDEIDLQEAAAFGREMVERSQRISAGETDLIPPVPKAPKSDFPGPKKWSKADEERIMEEERKQGLIPIADMNKVWLKFDQTKCKYPKCRICMDNCPVDGIDLSVKPPVVGKPCMNCMLCAFTCPTGAMYENEWSVKAYAEHARRQMSTFYLPPLAEAEKEGRFRRLVPVDKIGLDTPRYTKYTKHPRFIVGKGWQV